MTRDELLDLLHKLDIQPGYFCDQGPHRGLFRIKVRETYIKPDTLAALQKDLYEHRNEGIRGLQAM